MGIKWRDFQFPRKIVVDEKTYSPTYGKFIAEPFERGFGVTLGNSFRRVLLSYIEGAAVTSIRIDGVSHEFSSIPGVLEDLSEIILNIKSLVLKSFSRAPKKIHIKAEKKGEVTGADIITDESVEVINKDLHIATLTEDAHFFVEMEVGKGRGFVSEEFNRRDDAPVGTIAIDSLFAPVKKVNFKVESTRVGKSTDYDLLTLEVWTNGSIEPKDTLVYGANILSKHLELFMNLGQIEEEEEEEELTPEESSLYEKLKIPVSEIELSVRSANCLREANIKSLADLVEKTEQEILSYRNFGKKSLNEIVTLLKSMGLSLGTPIDKKKLEKA
ncbi:MAG: DNA-directed RNA polymerase subunit alpha [Candidatus Omnitrophica bacterium]|nr:DNA-directed RNA polymerase subunit alpha [Candidatus Omnitrophota bacterium]